MLTRRIVGVAVGVVLAVSVVAGQKAGEPSGIHGVPVEGHDIAAGLEIVGTTQIDVRQIRPRLQRNGGELRLGLPIEGQTLCRFREVLRDVMREKGFPEAQITHQLRPTYGNPQHLTLRFTVVEGNKSRSRSTPALTPAQRCDQ